MKKYFLTGLISLLPFTLTVLIVVFVVNFLTRPFQATLESALSYYHFFDAKFLIFSATQVLHFSSKLLILLVLFVLTLVIGFLGKIVFIKTLFYFGDVLLHRIPVFNKIYKAAQEIVRTLFDSKSIAFGKVVLVPFPNSKAYSLGFTTQESTFQLSTDAISIFVPGTPNPTMGFMLIYKVDQIIFTDMKVEDALKFVVSCGIMFPGFYSAVNENSGDTQAK